MGRTLRIFHISDLHMRSADGPQGERARQEAAERWRVLGDRWQENLDEIRRDGRGFDLVVFTGDLGDWGHRTDYPGAIVHLKSWCQRLDVPLDRLFLVPGNHDVDRTVAQDAWKGLREAAAIDPDAVSSWMAGGQAPRGIRDMGWRDAVLRRQESFWNAVVHDLGRADLAPWRSPHQRLGYRVSLDFDELTAPVHVIGLDSAWLAGDKNHANKLWLTNRQIDLLCHDELGQPLSGFRLALVHHRLADLGDPLPSRASWRTPSICCCTATSTSRPRPPGPTPTIDGSWCWPPAASTKATMESGGRTGVRSSTSS